MSALFKNKISWQKRGLLLEPKRELWWMRNYAMVPTVDILSGGAAKIYFSGRDDKNVSHIGYAVVDFSDDQPKILEFSGEPILSPGELGCFDDNGVSPSCVVHAEGKIFLYYIGWNPGSTVRMHLFGGLAISEDGGKSFQRYSRAPIIEPTKVDPFLNTGPHVIFDQGVWKMYYVSGVGWVHKDLPRYNIKYGESKDGREWKREGHVCIEFRDSSENALARPYVIREGGIYKMWFAHKGETYRLGYAESHDGKNWIRDDSFANLGPTTNGFDSEMMEYASVFTAGGKKIMIYNGNNYGKDGVAYAVEA